MQIHIVLVRNFIILDYTRQKCSVALFLAKYNETTDVDIVTEATAIDLEDGSTIGLVFDVWFSLNPTVQMWLRESWQNPEKGANAQNDFITYISIYF